MFSFPDGKRRVEAMFSSAWKKVEEQVSSLEGNKS
jgi:hypothetical protein